MNLLVRVKLSAHLIFPSASLPKPLIYLNELTSVSFQKCNFYATKTTYSSQKVQLANPKPLKTSETYSQRVKKASEALTAVWPKPREIPYQTKVANFVNFVGFVKTPVRFETDEDGKHLATTVISREGERNSLLLPVVFEGDLAHIVACHVKENDCVFVSGQLSVDPMRIVLSESLGKFHVVAENLNFVEGHKRISISDKKIDVLPVTTMPKKVEEIKEVVSDEEFNRQWKEAVEDVRAKSADAEVVPKAPAQEIWNRSEDEMSGKKSAASKKKDVNATLELWRDLVKNPLQWWDYRVHKANGLVKPKFPDFKQKVTEEVLWINSSPDWVLPGLAKLEFDVKPMRGAGGNKMDVAKGEDSWKDLAENPQNWWDNRVGKKFPKAPDFKHKETGASLWVDSAPKWALTKLPGLAKLEIDVKPMGGGGGNKMGVAKGEDSWKDLVENPQNWWDNRVGKKFPKAPDFKHKETGAGLWVNGAPKWALSELPPTREAYAVKM